MKRVLQVATRVVRPVYHWYRGPVGLLLGLVFATCLILALIGYERAAVVVLVIAMGVALPYQLQRSSDMARSALRQTTLTSETTSTIFDRMISLEGTAERVDHLVGKIEATHKLEREHAAQVKTVYAHTQLIAGLNHVLAPVAPLPHLNTWTLTADAADYLVRTILRDKPQLVVETGSGASTVLAGLALAKVGKGRIIALEHDKAFFEATKALLAEHKVEDYATVLYCPLRTQSIAGANYRWYNIDELDRTQKIDLLLIDGPPAATNDQARYPALPELWDMITANTQIVVDDAGREDEIEVVERWQRECGPISIDRFDHQRGSAVLRVSETAANSPYSRARSL